VGRSNAGHSHRRRFSDPTWIHERKFDGERCLVFRSGADVRLVTRNRRIVNNHYPGLAGAFARQKAEDFVVDGDRRVREETDELRAVAATLSDPEKAVGQGWPSLLRLRSVACRRLHHD